MKAYSVHYQNKYPGGLVRADDNCVDVWDAEGNYVVALRKNGGGQWVDASEEMGARDRHDLSPIPRETRVRKLGRDGNICDDEEAAERREARKKYIANGRVMSEAEFKLNKNSVKELE